MILLDLIKALKAGEEIANPAAWKKGTILTTALTTIILVMFKIFAPDFQVPDDLVTYLVDIVGGILIIINIFMTKATSKKV